jgi:hypothetical protein
VLHGFYGGADIYEGRHERHGGLRHDLATYKKIDGFAHGGDNTPNEHLLSASESDTLCAMAL